MQMCVCSNSNRALDMCLVESNTQLTDIKIYKSCDLFRCVFNSIHRQFDFHIKDTSRTSRNRMFETIVQDIIKLVNMKMLLYRKY